MPETQDFLFGLSKTKKKELMLYTTYLITDDKTDLPSMQHGSVEPERLVRDDQNGVVYTTPPLTHEAGWGVLIHNINIQCGFW